MNYYEESLKIHKKNHGKIQIVSTVPLRNRDDLSIAYTPGVAEPCRKIQENSEAVYDYTVKGNMVAVVSDGTAVLGLGDIGPEAAIPVMEGKAILFKEFAGIDAFPICLNTKNIEEIIQTVKNIAPCFGGINLEDIASPKCFDIEKRLEEELNIPVFHDDQHGTAIVVLAGLLNALRVTNKKINEIKIVLNGPGAAGTAIIKMLIEGGAKNIIACDEHGILYRERPGIDGHKKALCDITNLEEQKGNLEYAVKNSDVFIGVSVPGVLTKEMIQNMNDHPIVFAMANPIPEITYDMAKEAGVAIIGTGRSDYPNQINNVLAFPGIFKGALKAKARNITPKMKVAAANAIADMVSDEELSADFIIPNAMNLNVAKHVADAVYNAWMEEEY